MSVLAQLLEQHSVHPRLGAVGNVPTVDYVLGQMQGKTVTGGWDAVCVLDLGQANAYFLESYLSEDPVAPVKRLRAAVPVIPNRLYYELDLQLGPPLVRYEAISVDAAEDDVGAGQQVCALSMWITGGQLRQRETAGGKTVYTQVLTIPPDVGQVTGTVPLKSVHGTVVNGHDIVLDVGTGTYAAQMTGITPFVNQQLSPAVGAYFATHPYSYPMGTVVLDDKSSVAALVPSDFSFGVQQDANGSQALLVFVKTNGAGSSVDELGFLNGTVPIPAGFSAALFVSSRALFEGVLQPGYQELLDDHHVSGSVEARQPSDLGRAWSLGYTVGALTVGPYHATGSRWNTDATTAPLSGMSIGVSGNTLVTSWTGQWQVPVTYYKENPLKPGDWLPYEEHPTMNGQFLDSGTWTLGLSGAGNQTLSMTPPSNLDITFLREKSGFFDWLSGTGDAESVNQACDTIRGTLLPQFRAIFAVQLQPVSVMAVSNLAFGGGVVMWLEQAYAPGDLVVFGSVKVPVQVSPSYASLTAGQTTSFSPVLAGLEASGIRWSVSSTGGPPGTIDASSGKYQAPASIRTTSIVTVTATDDVTNDYGNALIVLNAPITVQPAQATVIPGEAVAFGAVMAGGSGSVTWSCTPAVGSIDPDSGVYTAPESVSADTVVTVTAATTANNALKATATATITQTIIPPPIPPPTTYPRVSWWAQPTPRQPNWVRGNQVRYSTSFYDASGTETAKGPWSPWIPVGDYALPFLVGVQAEPFLRGKGRRVYRQFTGDAQKGTQFRIADIADNTTTQVQDEWD